MTSYTFRLGQHSRLVIITPHVLESSIAVLQLRAFVLRDMYGVDSRLFERIRREQKRL